MPARTLAPYGTWASPITAQQVAAGTLPLAAPMLDRGRACWLQGLPVEGGRVAALRLGDDGAVEMLTPAPYDVRSRVHEYGGGACVAADGQLWFSNFQDHLVYRRAPDGRIGPITRRGAQCHADFALDARRARLLAVREDHGAGGREPRNTLVALPMDGAGDGVELAAGCDFYAAPRLSADGRRLAWLSWNHPSLPFVGTELWLADIDAGGGLADARRVAGGAGEALCQPQWSPGGRLVVVSDRSGWWNLHEVVPDGLRPVCPMQAEFARPMWQLGQRLYGFADDACIVAACVEAGESRLVRIDLREGRCTPLASGYTDIEALHVAPGVALAIAGAPTRAPELVRLDLDSGAAQQVLARSVAQVPPPGELSPVEPIRFPSAEGRVAHAFFYPPANAAFAGPPGERPPLVVSSHGGPTSMSTSGLRLSVHYWTHRGFAFADVNYGGSAGFGRAYRELLKGRWGIVDVQDVVAAARHLAATGRVDARRMAIRGFSASGFTTLLALLAGDVFRAGASYYGVADLARLDAQTHKFESHYTEYLIGPPAERARLDRERSPLHRVDGMRHPVLFFQGLDDRVVPPAQSQAMVDALRRRGIPTACLTFEGEGHGFRREATIRRCLEAELWFYGRVFGFVPADALEPVRLEPDPRAAGLPPLSDSPYTG